MAYFDSSLVIVGRCYLHELYTNASGRLTVFELYITSALFIYI